MKRARKAWLSGSALACAFGGLLCMIIFLFGTTVCSIFSKDPEVIRLASDFSKAYAVDTVFSAAMFCTCGYLNGCGRSGITLVQCMIGVAARIPAAFLLMNLGGGNMFITGLCIPISTLCQLIFLLIYLKVSESFDWSFIACISESLDGILDMSSCFNFFEGRDATRRP